MFKKDFLKNCFYLYIYFSSYFQGCFQEEIESFKGFYTKFFNSKQDPSQNCNKKLNIIFQIHKIFTRHSQKNKLFTISQKQVPGGRKKTNSKPLIFIYSSYYTNHMCQCCNKIQIYIHIYFFIFLIIFLLSYCNIFHLTYVITS